MFTRVQIRHRPRARFLGPEAIRILAQKMVVIRLVHDERDFRRPRGALLLETTHANMRIITQDSRNHIRARLRLVRVESPVSSRASRLMKGRVANLLSSALGNLLRVIHIHGVRETVVCVADFISRIPLFGLVLGFPATQGRLPFASTLYMVSAEGLSRQGAPSTFLSALTPVGPPRFCYFVAAPVACFLLVYSVFSPHSYLPVQGARDYVQA
jgi:hypothetical protein